MTVTPDAVVVPAGPAGRAPWTLRRRLVVAIVALLAIVGLLVGAISVAALRQNLITRLDQQVVASLGGPLLIPQADGGTGTGGSPVGDGPGRRVGTLLVVDDGSGVAQGGFTRDDGTVVELTDAQFAALGALDAPGDPPRTVDLGGELGAFRVVERTTSTGDTAWVGQSMSEVEATTWNLALIFGLVLLGALVVAALLGTWIVRVTLRPLDRIAATAGRVSELELARGAVSLPERVPASDADPRTEVGRVGSSLNRLLGHVEGSLASREESEQTLRRFIADASHELRTPLASIRGYAELSQRVESHLPPDVRHAVERIESESVRMTSLVEDLLLLARLDAGQHLARDRVDLTPLLADAVGDAHVAGPEHHWVLDLADDMQLESGVEVEVIGDPGRLHQVVANLLANARSHTPPGTTVVTSLAVDDGAAVIAVTDDGPGIDPELLPRLFERFTRGEASRSRAAGSTGLGLSIVHAIVSEHGGTVTATSEPGATRFEVRLPLAGS